MGDSKVIINWYTSDNNLQVISLQTWMTKIRELSSIFQQIKAHHIYRTYNQIVDGLSKEALLMDEGGIYCSKVSDRQQRIFEKIDISREYCNFRHKEDIIFCLF